MARGVVVGEDPPANEIAVGPHRALAHKCRYRASDLWTTFYGFRAVNIISRRYMSIGCRYFLLSCVDILRHEIAKSEESFSHDIFESDYGRRFFTYKIQLP